MNEPANDHHIYYRLVAAGMHRGMALDTLTKFPGNPDPESGGGMAVETLIDKIRKTQEFTHTILSAGFIVPPEDAFVTMERKEEDK